MKQGSHCVFGESTTTIMLVPGGVRGNLMGDSLQQDEHARGVRRDTYSIGLIYSSFLVRGIGRGKVDWNHSRIDLVEQRIGQARSPKSSTNLSFLERYDIQIYLDD